MSSGKQNGRETKSAGAARQGRSGGPKGEPKSDPGVSYTARVHRDGRAGS